jgi:hypothetical protein
MFTTNLQADSEKTSGKGCIAKIDSTIAAVDSSIKVTGVAIIPGKRTCIILNDKLVWEGEKYTYDAKTGKVIIRAKVDEKQRLPELTLDKIVFCPICDKTKPLVIVLQYKYWVKKDNKFVSKEVPIYKLWRFELK